MSSVVPRFRQQRVFIDSRDHTKHINRNPGEYTFRFPVPVPNVVGVRLLSLRVPYSPLFTVIRTSKWMNASIADDPSQFDTVHLKAAALVTAGQVYTPETNPRPVTIYTADGTVSLNVIDTFSITKTRSSDSAVRTYDVYVCTGTLATSSRTDWQIQDLTDPTNPDLPLSGASADTAFAYAAADAGVSAVAVDIDPQSYHLRINTGQSYRINAVRTELPEWKSFRLYYPGNIVKRGTSVYECVTKHLSLIASDDIPAYFVSISGSTRVEAPANRAFYVFEATDTSEAIVQVTANNDEITAEFPPQTVTQITVGWYTRAGNRVVFPHAAITEYESFTDATTPASYDREYEPHSMQLSLDVLQERETLGPLGRKGRGPASFGMLTSPLMLPERWAPT